MAYQNQRYSRLNRIEDNKSKRTIFVYIFLSLFFVGFMIFLAPRILGALVASINIDTTQVGSTDNIAPSPPRINIPSQVTNNTSITISGAAEPGASVVVFSGSDKTETIADDQGNFSTNVDLQKGSNKVYAKAIDLAGNESSDSREYVVVYDNDKPEMEITKPKEGEQFFGSSQRQITLEGKTETEAKVTINDRVAIVDANGNFKFTQNMGDGENSFNIKSTDQAGNQTELTIKVTFTP